MPGDHGAFDDRASDASPQLWAATHRGLTLGGLVAAAAVVAGAALMGGSDRGSDGSVHAPSPGLTPEEREELRSIIEDR